MTAALKDLLTHEHVLLLQGKMGSFFSRFAYFLREQGLDVSKVNFNGGDVFYYKHQPAYAFKDRPDHFSDWLHALVDTKKIDAVVCFGDCREHHRIAAQLCKHIGLSFYVFEEGYLRPDYITFEKHGINGYSRFPTDLIEHSEKASDHPQPTLNRFYKMVWSAICYYILCVWRRREFPHYEHYRHLTAWQEASAWFVALYRKFAYHRKHQAIQNKFVNQLANQYFLVTLQVYQDTQISHHSDYRDVVNFLEDVIVSFANHAQKAHHLLIKHHPLDRGHRNYHLLIKRLAERHGVQHRVAYGCDMHLPTLIKSSLGMITINSTTGLQSLYHKKPVKVMGRAIYNVPRLTAQCGLDEFWKNIEPVDFTYYLKFRQLLIKECQLNGSLYGKSPWMDDMNAKA